MRPVTENEDEEGIEGLHRSVSSIENRVFFALMRESRASRRADVLYRREGPTVRWEGGKIYHMIFLVSLATQNAKA